MTSCKGPLEEGVTDCKRGLMEEGVTSCKGPVEKGVTGCIRTR